MINYNLRATYYTLLIKNDFNLKAISTVMGQATEISSVEVYGDNEEIISDCLDELNPFIERVVPKDKENIIQEIDFSAAEDMINIADNFISNYMENLLKML